MLLLGLYYAREPSAIAAGLLPSKGKLCLGWMRLHKRWTRKHLCLSQFHRENLQYPSHELLAILLIVEIQWSWVLCYLEQEYRQLLLFLIIGLNPFVFFFNVSFLSLQPLFWWGHSWQCTGIIPDIESGITSARIHRYSGIESGLAINKALPTILSSQTRLFLHLVKLNCTLSESKAVFYISLSRISKHLIPTYEYLLAGSSSSLTWSEQCGHLEIQ